MEKRVNLSYTTKTKQILPNGREIVFSHLDNITTDGVLYGDYYIYELTDVKNVSIANDKLTPMDEISIELGRSVFPVQFKVSKDNVISGIYNFREVKERRSQYLKKILRKCPTEEFNKIVDVNLASEDDMIRYLYHNVFIQFYFIPKSNMVEKELFNYPYLGNKLYLSCKNEKNTDCDVKFNVNISDYFKDGVGEGEIEYKLNEDRIPVRIYGSFSCNLCDKKLKKEISIDLVDSKF